MPAYYANKKIWNAIWGLKTPTKIKALVSKLLHDGISIWQKLHSQILAIDASCPWCISEEESAIHYVVTCHFSDQVWNCMGIPASLKALPSTKFWHWWKALVETWKNDPEGENKLNLLDFGLWGIWIARNKKVFKGKVSTPKEIHTTALTFSVKYN